MKLDKRSNNNASHLIKDDKQRKKPITIHETGEDIEFIGGLVESRKFLKDFFAALVEAKRKGQKLDVRFY